MKFIPGILIFSVLFFSKLGHANLAVIDNACSRYVNGDPSTEVGTAGVFEELGAAQIIEDGVRFLGFDIVDVGGVRNLSARFASQDLDWGYTSVSTDNQAFLCGRHFGLGESKRSSWAVHIPVEKALGLIEQGNEVEIILFGFHQINGEEKRSYSKLKYHQPALLRLLKKDISVGLPYNLEIEHPRNMAKNIYDRHIVYCLNSNWDSCDYTIEDHPRYHTNKNDLGVAIPFKGHFIVDGYITRLLFKEDIAQGAELSPTEFGLWNRYGKAFELGALRGNAKAFLSQFFTLSYMSDPVTSKVLTKIAWDIPMQHGEFLDHDSYVRDYETYLMMNFAFEVNILGSVYDAAAQGYSKAEYAKQMQQGMVAITGLTEAQTGAFKQAPLTVTYP
ncbi:hypothetical protein N480_17005 [Pseudoalteromonas luteoviolacea S2607]|uniref:hypothetical protein n=1 Tax=Pseudoalteromonas luteoviolacea TaxID=43657 RepID=UPI0007B06C10|nr:hypothetical protein [Pseudoalteromonas luteoviolacea]KZN36962.1 hypothetical protein N480_17005 [Pseudoalteromonas luteoviolacea S2607]